MKIQNTYICKMKNYDWYLFDLDNTVLDFTETAKLAFEDMVSFFEMEKVEDAYRIYNTINKKYWSEYERGFIDADTVKYGRFEEFSAAINMDIDAKLMSKKYAEFVLNHSFIIDDALSIISYLRDKANLAIITNGLSHMQHDRIAKHNLQANFKHVFISDEMKVSKPDIRFFEIVHKTIGAPEKSKVLVCGDNPHSDIKGANNFGYHSLFFNYYKSPSHHIEAHYKLNDWKDFF